MTTETVLGILLGLVVGGVSIPLLIRTVRVVREARQVVGRFRELSSEHEQMRIVLFTILANVRDQQGRYRITKTKRAKAEKIGSVSWKTDKSGALVIETKGIEE